MIQLIDGKNWCYFWKIFFFLWMLTNELLRFYEAPVEGSENKSHHKLGGKKWEMGGI